jgi:hypothetical protein
LARPIVDVVGGAEQGPIRTSASVQSDIYKNDFQIGAGILAFVVVVAFLVRSYVPARNRAKSSMHTSPAGEQNKLVHNDEVSQVTQHRSAGVEELPKENYEYDVFICHASEDKEQVARPLAELLSKNLRVWYDEFELRLGDSLRQKIDDGLANSKYGVVILSPSFFGKNWPQKELDGLVSREDGKQKVILPVWHDVTYTDVVSFSPILAGKYAVSTKDGLGIVVRKIWEVTSLQPTVFDRMVDLEAQRRLLKFSFSELSDELNGYVSACRSEPTDDEVKDARRLLNLEPEIDRMDPETISGYLDEVRDLVLKIDRLWDVLSQAMEPSPTDYR